MSSATAYGTLMRTRSEDDLNDNDEVDLTEQEQQVLEHMHSTTTTTINTINTSQPPQLPLNLQFEFLSLDGSRPRGQSSASIGTIGSAVLNLVRSKIPSPEPTYDMVETSDDEVDVGKNVGIGKSGSATNMSSPILVDRPGSAAGLAKLDNGSDRMVPRRERGAQVDGGVDTPPPSHIQGSRAKYTSPLENGRNYGHHYRQDTHDQDESAYRYMPYSEQAYTHSQDQLQVRNDRDTDRPSTSDSRLFADFDGIHFNPELSTHQRRQSEELHMGNVDFPQPEPRPRATRHQPNNSGSVSSKQDSSSLIYYPAPVPALINLPPTLAKKKPTNSRDSHASHRKSIVPGAEDDQRKDHRKSVANLPPSLRASVFFDTVGGAGAIEIPVKEDSAVATLDSILDASAKAPPIAFTEHPLTGGSGKEFVPPSHVKTRPTGKVLQPGKRQSVMSLGHAKKSSSADALILPELQQKRETTSEIARDICPTLSVPSAPPGGTQSASDSASQPSSHQKYTSDDSRGRSFAPPTSLHHRQSQLYLDAPSPSPLPPQEPEALPITLLAELEARQAHQRSRNRTAASAFPSGIRSTLLELDTVAEVQKESRRMKRTHLAWEAPEEIEKDREDDEDMPLGLIYGRSANKKNRSDEDIPLGLLVRKEIEDNEPLSKRRERLKVDKGKDGNEKKGGSNLSNKRSTMYLNVPGLPSPSDSGSRVLPPSPPPDSSTAEDEPLGIRMKKLKEKKAGSAQFGTGSLGNKFEEGHGGNGKEEKEKEETLGQRRKRLQMEREQKQKAEQLKRDSLVLQVEVRKRRSMLDMKQQLQQAQLGNLEGGVQNVHALSNTPVRSQSNLGFYHGAGAGLNMNMNMYPGRNILASRSSTFLGNNGMNVMGGGAPVAGDMMGMRMGMHPMYQHPGGRAAGNLPMRGSGVSMGMMSNHAMAGGGGPLMAPVAQSSLQDQRQREMVERWRSSIM